MIKKIFSRHWPFITLLILYSIYFFWGMATVPFHPDESAYIYMSQDLENAFSNPLSLAWNSDSGMSAEMRYRLIDAPITRDLIGVGRVLTGQANLLSDWDWAKTWQQNQASGALPSPGLLRAARFSLASLLPLTLINILFWSALGRQWCRLAGQRVAGHECFDIASHTPRDGRSANAFWSGAITLLFILCAALSVAGWLSDGNSLECQIFYAGFIPRRVDGRNLAAADAARSRQASCKK